MRGFFNVTPDFPASTSHHISLQGALIIVAMRQNHLLEGAAGNLIFPRSWPAF